MFHRLSVLACLTVPSAFGLPALAQETPQFCGATQVKWLAEDEAGQDITSAEAPLSARVQVTGGQPSVLAFRSTAGSQALRIEASTDSGDPAVSLMTEDGDMIAENDDSPGSLNPRLDVSVGPGAYCIAVRSVGDSNMTATVQVSRPEQAVLLEENEESTGSNQIAACTPDTPAALLAEGALDGQLAQGPVSATQEGTEVGYYRFTLPQTVPLTLRASSPTLDSYLKLFDAQGMLIAESDDADGLNARLDFLSALTPGEYCIGAAALTRQPGQLTISAERLEPENFLRNAYRKGELSPPADGSYPVQQIDPSQKQSVILHDGTAQWMALDLDQPTVLIIRGYGSFAGSDPRLVLFAASGALEAENDDVDGGTDARLGPVLLEPGRYHLGVLDVSRNNGTAGPIRPIGLRFERFQRVE
ncbi:PPC domain-containing protein [Paracoccus benzoatiresistens]|uniref:PPC domain-containing protein n=1 Tax=Paracoccus benzoatiresistens TaxID=2997341 RepID=A0ABT4J5E4_9RHOB|nr:PPC domain-containing protein [Paracoccus sp. EF6]MCZ0961598.1 PPC domain-containing protein [Paracoccus sp. EF6]